MVSAVRPIGPRPIIALATAVLALAAAANAAPPGPGGVELVYRARPGTLTRTTDALKRRLAALGAGDWTIARPGRDRISVTVPDRATADRVKGTLAARGRLAYYDWEADVLGTDGRPHPRDAAVTGAQAAGGLAGTHTRAVARRIAARHRGAAVVVQAEPEPHVAAGFFALADHAALHGSDLTHARQARDPTTARPIVTLAFTRAGAARFHALTRTLARRGQALIRPGDSSLLVAQHFAVVLDGRLLSVPYLNPQENPDGVDGRDGSQISGAFTVASARGLAATIDSGPLPAALHLLAERQR